MIVRARKEKGMMVIEIPDEFKVKEGTKYRPILDSDGIISFVPVHKNIFEQVPDYDVKAAIREMDLGDNGD